MSDKQAWVSHLRTIRAWSKLLGTGYKNPMGLQLGLLDEYSELCTLSRILKRSVPQWVKGKL